MRRLKSERVRFAIKCVAGIGFAAFFAGALISSYCWHLGRASPTRPDLATGQIYPLAIKDPHAVRYVGCTNRQVCSLPGMLIHSAIGIVLVAAPIYYLLFRRRPYL